VRYRARPSDFAAVAAAALAIVGLLGAAHWLATRGGL